MRTTARNARLAALYKKRHEAMQLWGQGATYRQIGEALGVSTSTAHHYVERELAVNAKLHDESNERKKQKLWIRTETTVRSAMGRLTKESSTMEVAMIVDSVTKATKAMAQMFGLNAPTKIASTDPTGENWAPLSANLMQALTDEQLVVAIELSRMRLQIPKPGELPPRVVEATYTVEETRVPVER